MVLSKQRQQRPAQRDRTVALRRTQPLPTVGEHTVEAMLRVLPGAPSLEGSELTTVTTERRFSLQAALHVVEHGCGRSLACWPGLPWTIRFNQPLRPAPGSGA